MDGGTNERINEKKINQRPVLIPSSTHKHSNSLPMLKPNVLILHPQKVLLASSAHRLHLLLPLPSLAGGWDGLGLKSSPQRLGLELSWDREQGSSRAAQA